MREYIKRSTKKAHKEKREFNLWNKIPVYIVEQFVEEIDLGQALEIIEKSIPEHLFDNVDAIYVGNFKAFEIKKTNAAYEDGAIYVTNNQVNEKDLIDDIIHESSHAVEETFNQEIYEDGTIEQEFLGKRKRLFYILQEEGIRVNIEDIMNIEYSSSFDRFLYEEVGYPLLTSLAMGLFISPYGITSLKEYFANAYEHYFLGEQKYVRTISPQVFKTIEKLVNYKYDYRR